MRQRCVAVGILTMLAMAPFLVKAAEAPRGTIYFVAAAPSAAPGSEVSIGVMLDAPVPVNAVSVELAYASEALSFVRINTSNSFIDVWRGIPEVHRDGIVRLEGGATEPFQGHAGEIARLTFAVRGEESAMAQWSFRSARAVAADGYGTELALDHAPLSLPVTREARDIGADSGDAADTIPPRITLMRVVPSPVGDVTLGVWDARDEGSGVARTEVRFLRWFVWGPWTVRENPVRLPSDAWGFAVRVSDRAGNHAERAVVMWNRALPLALIPMVIGFGAVWIFLRRKIRRVLQ